MLRQRVLRSLQGSCHKLAKKQSMSCHVISCHKIATTRPCFHDIQGPPKLTKIFNQTSRMNQLDIGTLRKLQQLVDASSASAAVNAFSNRWNCSRIFQIHRLVHLDLQHIQTLTASRPRSSNCPSICPQQHLTFKRLSQVESPRFQLQRQV